MTEKYTSNENYDDEINKETKNHQENMICYGLLWIAIIAGFIAQFFIEPTYQFSTTTFGIIWLVGFIVSIYVVFATRQRFRDYNLLFIIIAPFSIIFWLSVVSSSVANKDNENKELKIQKGDIINEFKNSDPKDWNKNQKWQQVNKSTQNELGNNPSSEQIRQLLDGIAEELSQDMPLKIDDNITATDVLATETDGKLTLYSFYEVARPIYNVDTENLKSRMIREQNFCKVNETLLRYGITLIYVYSNNTDKGYNGKYQLNFHPQDCGY